jgi:predicted nucleic acid-binding protein
MSSEPSGSMVFDTSVLVELALDSLLSIEVQDNVRSGQVQPLTGELNVTELGYILCRSLGSERSARSVELLRKAKEIRILSSASFLDRAAEMKCTRSISLVDCVTLAMGESLNVPVLFAKCENELKIEMKKKSFKTKLLFMEK